MSEDAQQAAPAPAPAPVAASPAGQKPQVRSESKTSQVGWMSLVLACVMTSMLTIAVNTWLMRDRMSGAVQHFVFVDSGKLVDAKAIELSEQKLSESDSAKAGADFANEMQNLIARYQEQGFTVLNSAVLLGEQEANDVTREFAKQLNVRLDLKLTGESFGSK